MEIILLIVLLGWFSGLFESKEAKARHEKREQAKNDDLNHYDVL